MVKAVVGGSIKRFGTAVGFYTYRYAQISFGTQKMFPPDDVKQVGQMLELGPAGG